MARLKLLYEDIMRPPETADEISPTSTTAHSSVATSKEKSTSGKKTDEGKGKRDKSVKDKKCKAMRQYLSAMGIKLAVFTASKMKEREMKEIKEEPLPQPKAPASSSEQLKLNIPKWDLSIQGLQQVHTTCVLHQ